MINIVKIVSTDFNSLKQRLVKVLRLGKIDVQTPLQASTPGIDSCPIKDMVAVYAKSESDSGNVIIGYILKNQIAKPGENRLFSTNDQGTEKFYIYLKDNGEVEIGGNSNFAVKYNELKQENDKLKDTVDTLVTKWNAFCAAYVPGGPSSVGSPPTLATSNVPANSSNFALIKNDKILTIG